MTNQPTMHLTPSERYFRGEITLDQATRDEVNCMVVERRETPFPLANFVIQLLILVVALPVLIFSFLSPRRWFS